VRLGSGTEPAQGRFEGSAEEVDTGKRLNFRSAEEVLRFPGVTESAVPKKAPGSERLLVATQQKMRR
jgi:hypothetical protein